MNKSNPLRHLLRPSAPWKLLAMENRRKHRSVVRGNDFISFAMEAKPDFELEGYAIENMIDNTTEAKHDPCFPAEKENMDPKQVTNEQIFNIS
jgi:hypothetical protein